MMYLDRVNDIFDGLRQELVQLALEIHQNPELGMQEHRACALQTALLEKYGFCVERNFCGMETAYKATYKGKKPGPKIAMLAEYDALPDLGHACGHNLIAMISCGAGIALREFADTLGGEIQVIGTPAEETVGAKAAMACAGVFDTLDVAMMSHGSFLDCESLDTLAVKSVTFDFYGKAAHASGFPQDGINALDAVISCFNLINALRQQTQEDARIHGIITKGGEAPNIIPAHTQAFFFVRAAKIDYLEALFEKVCSCAKAAALGTGCTVDIQLGESQFSDTNSNRALSALNTHYMEALGVAMTRATEKPLPGSSDMGNASYRCPAIQNMFEVTHFRYVPLHSPEFEQLCKTEHAMEKALLFAKGHVLTAIDLMENPAHLEAIQTEFAKISKRP